MTAINARQVQSLREKTGAGIMDCKEALAAEDGDLERATVYLRKKGLAAAAKKSGRLASEGVVGSYIHGGGKIGVLVEVNCETDFVARTDSFVAFIKDLSMHVAAAAPQVVRRDELDEAQVARERDIIATQVAQQNKPEQIAERMREGRLEKYFADTCLLEQSFVKDPGKTVEQVLNDLVAKLGEKLAIRRFVRFQLGEGLARRSENFAEEVQRAAAGG